MIQLCDHYLIIFYRKLNKNTQFQIFFSSIFILQSHISKLSADYIIIVLLYSTFNIFFGILELSNFLDPNRNLFIPISSLFLLYSPLIPFVSFICPNKLCGEHYIKWGWFGPWNVDVIIIFRINTKSQK